MGLFDFLFGKKQEKNEVVGGAPRSPAAATSSPARAPETSPLGLMDPDDVARKEIDQATAFADRAIQLNPAGHDIVLTSLSPSSMELASYIDKAITKAPHDLDLLLAKSAALCCAAQFKAAEELVDQVLSIKPDHFQARQRKQHWNTWKHVLSYPPWSSSSTSLDLVMQTHVEHGHAVQLIRDGLQIGIAVIRSVQSDEFPKPLSNTMRSKWEPVWSETPSGPVVAHYMVLEDNPADPYKTELFLPIFVPTKAVAGSGYWLLQTLPHVGSCFCVFAVGTRVIYNRRYVFPEQLRSALRSIADKVIKYGPSSNDSAFDKAVQWHTQNFDLKRIRF
jgi:hypothetical protein